VRVTQWARFLSVWHKIGGKAKYLQISRMTPRILCDPFAIEIRDSEVRVRVFNSNGLMKLTESFGTTREYIFQIAQLLKEFDKVEWE
jgi:hypothetical protein